VRWLSRHAGGGAPPPAAALERVDGTPCVPLRRVRRELVHAARENTLLWFSSDNGISWAGVPEDQQKHLFNGGRRGHKESHYEGGVRVPGIIEWPAAVKAPRQSSVPCVTSDILPTVLDPLGLKHPAPSRHPEIVRRMT
jgi:arylsulfatase A-like enzyme